MATLRETEADKKRQTRLFEVFSSHKELNFGQFSSSNKKYRIDGYLYDESKNIRAWVECKWYNNRAHCFLNVPKYKELISLSSTTTQPSFLLFREHNKWGYICLHTGLEKGATYDIRLTGGTPKGRVINEDDIEPLVVLHKKFITWGN
jgi:hypothetical protein